MVKDFHLNLATVSMSGQRKLDAEFGSAMERVWIVREENIGHVAADQRLDIRKGLLLLAIAHPFALVVDADKIELRTFESD